MNKQYIQDNKDNFIYLFELQRSGICNMFGAGVYLQNERGLSRNEAREVLMFWMQHYEDIAKELDIEV
jgi:hypothetical protein